MTYWKYTLTAILFFLFSLQLSAQECGCTDCPQNLQPGRNYQVCFEIVGATNNDLLNSNQGICGVELVFEHERIENLNMSLVSPAGQSVQLIGNANPVGLCGGATQTANVTFLPSSETAMPMAGTNAFWDNDDYCPPGIDVEGSYYPFSGNLEDFNIGAVNGTWCLEITTLSVPPFSGELINLNILLCDPTGLNCCFAEAGTLIESDTILCEADPYLDYSFLMPNYTSNAPDEDEYGYLYLIGENGIILDYTDAPNLVDAEPGNYTICGLSYRLTDEPAFPAPNGVLTMEDLRTALNSLNAPFCGQMTDDCIEVEIVEPITPTELDESICEGDTIFIDDMPFFLSGFYEINLSGYGCDSLVRLNLEVIDIPTVTIDTTICFSEVVIVGNNTYNEEGTFETVLNSSRNCDSIVILNIVISNPPTVSFTERICEGECFMLGDSCYTEEGFHIINFQTEENCDSIVTLNLIVQPIHAEIAEPDSLGCGDDMIRLDGRGSDNNTNISFQWYYQNQAIASADENILMVSDTGSYSLEVFHSTTMCRDTAFVTVYSNTQPPTAIIETPQTLTCQTASVDVVGSNSTGTGSLNYEWQTVTGNIQGSTTSTSIRVTSADIYTLIVTNTENQCKDTASIEVLEEIVLPIVNAGPEGLLSCEMLQDTLDGTGSATGPFIEYQWVTDTGNIQQGANTLMPIIELDGAYTLIVTNTENGCMDSATVLVNQEIDLPNVNITRPDTLTCQNSSVQIDASTSDQGGMFIFEWLVIDGHIVPPTENTLQPTVDEPGIYQLTITNTITNCSQTNVVTVAQQIIPPHAIATADGVMTCVDSEVTLDASLSNGNHSLSYEWRNSNFDIISNMISVAVSTAETYYLTVTDIVTQCQDRDTITVMADTLSPIAEAGSGFEINCMTTEGRLDGSDSSLGMRYLWTGPGIVQDESTLGALVNVAGWYYVNVTNPANGCTAIDSVEVTINNVAPLIEIGDAGTITCIDTCISLNVNVLPSNNDFIFNWIATNGGQIKTGADSLQPSVNAGGTYTLSVTDMSNHCTTTAVVIIDDNNSPPIAHAGLDGLLDCDNDTYVIGDLSSSSGGNIEYLWSTQNGWINPNDLNTLQIEIDSAGTYILTVMDNDNGCQTNDTVVVNSNIVRPTIEIIDPDTLNCDVFCVALDASNTSGNGMLNYQWSTVDGHIKNGETTPIANVDEAGLYTLEVTNTTTGCVNTRQVTVVQDGEVPMAVAQNTVVFDCLTGLASLDGTGSSAGNDYVYQWLALTPDANVSMGQNNLMAQADATGTYLFIVTDIVRNCADSTTVVVTEDCTPRPTAFADTDTLNCYSGQTMLHGLLSPPGNNLTFSWFWVENNTVINTTNLNVPISNGGTYIFTVTNNDFNTTGSDTVVIVADREAPIADAGPSQVLTCINSLVNLGGNATSQGAQFSYLWGTDVGNILDTDTLITVQANESGIYDLTVTNLENGCSDTDFTNITVDETFIDICFNPPFEITCITDELLIDATCSTTSPTIEHLWTTNTGNIISSTQNLTVRVNAPGMYYLRSTDTDNGCTALDSILITAQDCNLAISTSGDATLTCNVEEVTLSAIVMPSGETYELAWTDANGLTISDSLAVTVNMEGNYIFTATNLTTGQTKADTVSVNTDETPPVADAGQPSTLDCDTDMVTLDGSLSDQNSTVIWTSLGGHPISSPNDFQTTVRDTGLYQITVTSLDNGCMATDQVLIDDNFDAPMADAGMDQEMTCSTSSVILSGENSTLNQTSFLWTALSGNPSDVCAGGTTFTPVICSAGTYVLTVRSNINGCTATDTVEVRLNGEAPNASAGADQMLNCDITSVTLAGSGPPLGAFSVSWRKTPNGPIFGLNDYNPQVNEPGIYEIRIMNIMTGCDSTDLVQVRQDTLRPTANAGMSDTITCMSPTLTLSGSALPVGNYSYLWESENNYLIQNANTLTPTVSAADVYTLIVTNNNNLCQDSAQVTIFQDENLPSVFAGNDTVLTCETTNITLLGNVPNAANLDLTWTNMDGEILSNSLSLNISEADTFRLTAFNPANNCSFSDVVIVAQNITAPTAIITAPNTLLTCEVDSLILNAEASMPMGNLAYEWRRNNNPTIISNMLTVTVRHPDTYHLTVINLENSCEHDTTILITQDEGLPLVSIANPADLTCLIDTVVLNGTATMVSNPTYIWTNENGQILSNELTLSVAHEGNYTLTVINGDNGCDNDAVILVENNEDLPEVVASVVDNLVLDCENQSVTVTAQGSASGGNFTYQWTNPNGTMTSESQFSTHLAGLYILEIRNNDNGCSATDSVIVLADASLITGVEVTVDEQDCYGVGDATLFINEVIGGNGPYSYRLNNDIFKSFPQFDYLSPGAYELQVEDAFGCSWDTLITIAFPAELLVELGEDIFIQLGEEADLEAMINGDYASIKWENLDSLSCPDCINQVVQPLETTIYNVSVQNENGCVAEDQVTVFVAKDRHVYLPNVFSPDTDNSNQAYMVFGGKDVEKIIVLRIFDRWGNLVFGAENFPPNDPAYAWDGTLDGKPLNPEVFVYMVEVLYKDGYREMLTGDISLLR